jgi:hypothetical protein
MKYMVKIVPKSDPNADGEWVEIELEQELPLTTRWLATEAAVANHIPETHFVVRVERVDDIRVWQSLQSGRGLPKKD